MAEAMTLNMGSFASLSCDEMLVVDGGAWGARQWTACGLIVVGTACAVVGAYCPSLWGVSAKTWSAAGAILAGAGGIVAIG